MICNTNEIKVTRTIPWNGAATVAYATQATVSSMECEVTIPLNSWIGSLYFYPLSYSVFFFWLHHTACRILYPQPDMEPRSPEVEAWSPNYWTTKEFSYFLTFLFQIYNWLSKILWIFFYNLKYKLQKVHKRDSLTLTYCNITRKNGNNSVVPTLGYKLWICTQNTTQPLTTIMENNWRMKGRQII